MSVWASASLLREDGLKLSDWRQWLVRRPADLPGAKIIADEVEAMSRALIARRDAEAVEWYEGPVLFKGQAAAGLLRALLPRELRGTPPEPEAGRTYTQQTRSGPRLGRKLLPDGWSVRDDAQSHPGEVGGFEYDREGVRSLPVQLVEGGFVRDLLMSRIPRAELGRSNGHARGQAKAPYAARLSQWTVEPAKNLKAPRFDKELGKLWKASGVERILVVRRLGHSKDGTLPRPREAIWRYPDGREQPALALLFQNVDRRTLRDIALAGGGQQQAPYLAGWSSTGKPGTTQGLPTLLSCPRRLLVQVLEAVFPGPEQKPHALPAP